MQVAVSTAIGPAKSTPTEVEEGYNQVTETTMSFVLQLDVEAATAPVVENTKDVAGEEQPPSTLLFAREIWRSQEPVTAVTGNTTTGNTVVITSSDDATVARNNSKSQLAQCPEPVSGNQQQTTALSTTVKSVVTYPVAKGVREQQRIAGSQTNTTPVLTTRVISQKLSSSSSSTGQTQPLPVTTLNIINVSASSTSLPTPSGSDSVIYPLQTTASTTQSSQLAKNQTVISETTVQGKQQQQLLQQTSAASNVQATLHYKYQPVPLQQHIVNATVKNVNTVAAASNIQRIHMKTAPPNVVATGQPAQTVNLQKVKTVTSVNANQSVAGVVQRNNSSSRIQPKSQMSTGQINQLMVNNQATACSANSQKVQQGNSAILQKTTTTQQLVNAANTQKVGFQSVCNNQKISSQLSSGGHHANHKTQQYMAGNQQTQQSLGLQKLQGSQKSLAAAKQQQQSASQQVNNISKCSNPVTGSQKSQILGQHLLAAGQKLTQRSQSTTTGLQKSQTLTTVQTAANRTQIATSNVCKSNSVPNVSKLPQHNSSTLTVSKQQATQSQQQQPIMQKSQQQQSASANKLQSQRSHSITNVHQKVIMTVPNNQRAQDLMNSKVQQQQQQQMVMRVGMSKSQAQASQPGASLKGVSKQLVNSVKSIANSQNNTIQQSVVQRNNTSAQPVKIVQQQQQQQQNVIGPQNAPQKQPGCIKTIPPQKPVQRNHAQKIGGGIKTSLNTNVTTLTKVQGPASTPVMQKANIKTLLPQQMIVASSNIMAAHKNSPIKIQQQAMQQKQLIMAPQYTQQIRQQVGQIKTLLPVTSTTSESRKDVAENKNDIEFRMSKEEEHNAPKSPVRRMPLPYECLQFVLQDHNYGAPPPRTPPPPPPSPPPHSKQQPINGAGSSTATTQHSYIFGPVMSNTNAEDDVASVISSEAGREAEPEGEETETAPEGEGDDEDSVTRCICDFEHDDGYMICCDRCLVWQHVDCMGIDRSNIPDEYLCERCRPRRVDRQRARALQMRKREELLNSDTSSDTSSTSSADTDVGSVNNTAVQKKRSLPQQQSQMPRRSKSDASSQPAQQVRRLNNNNNNNNNVAKRQRRDSHARQASAVRKKENATPKRGPGKRKAKRRMSLEDKEEEAQDAWGTNMAPLRQWIERYEEAVTNHYSPELRARISSIKVNGTHSDLRQCNMNVIATGKCRLNVHSNNLRFLVATMYLPPNTPVVELRGKYMLSTQHRPQHPQGGRQHAQRPGPFVFFYRLPRDGTEVCVDTRTYGNDARFVRRSCKPNAEVKHCIEKGTLHLYIVTTNAIEKNAEITIKHEQHDLLLSPNPNSPALPVVCACNNPRECQITNAAANQLNRRGSNGALAENADGRERRRRGRRNTLCEETDPAPPVVSTSVAQVTTISTSSTSSSSSTVTVATPRRTVTTAVTTTTTRQVSKEEPVAATVTNVPPQTSPSLSHLVTTTETKKDKKKMTREERKMEAIMKAFERMEKAELRKQEVQARNAQRKESSGTHSDNEDSHLTTGQSKSCKQANSERPLRRKRRKGRARTTSTSQSQNNSRRTRLNSAESDVSSGDESNSMQSPPLLSQNRTPNRDIPYSSHLHTPGKNTTMIDGANNTGSPSAGHQAIPTAAGLLLALANSNASGPPSSPPLQQPTPVKSPTCDSGASSSSQSSTPSTPLSSACLLVAAAVGPLAPGFKFPKTKKVLMNEWLKESPNPPQTGPQVSPLPALPSAPTLHNSMNPLCARPSEFSSLQTADPSAEFLSQSYAAKSLATLVQAANSVSGICDSLLQRNKQATVISGNSNNNGSGPAAASSGSAKKRWLRQAISEECDSPNSRPESPPPLCETVAPPKKRRIARESLSSDNYTPPTTPTMLLPTEAVGPNSRSLCPMEDDYMEHEHSPIVERNEEKHYKSDSVKKEINEDDRPMDSDEPIREKLSIDIFPQTDFYVKNEEKPVKPECSDIVKREKMSPVAEMEDVTIKEEKVSSKWEKNDMESKCDYGSLDPKIFAKIRKVVESGIKLDDLRSKIEPFPLKEAQVFTRGTVEIVDQNEPDTEMEEFNSPTAVMESDAILKQRVAEMQLEFSGGVAEIVNIVSNENEKSDDEKKSKEIVNKCQDIVEKSDDNTSIDEFDVEAQMKKITGDDGNDYQEKIDVSLEKDKSMDGIEGLMESSKEDSDSEDKDMDDYESTFKFLQDHEETSFQELDSKSETKLESIAVTQDDTMEGDKNTSPEVQKEVSKEEQQSSAFTTLSTEESIFESATCNADAESVEDPPKIFHSIPPLSERIRKKADPANTPKTPKIDFEVAIIESTISMDTVDESKNGEEKSILSTALRELLEAKLDDESVDEVMKNNIDNEVNASSQVAQAKESSECSSETVKEPTPVQEAPKSEETSCVKEGSVKETSVKETSVKETSVKETFVKETSVKETSVKETSIKETFTKDEEDKPKEIKQRLKDPRTVVPNSMPAPSAFKSDAAPVKRKLSISEYRKRKQQSSGGTGTEPESSNDASTTDKSGTRGRSDSASSGTSSLSSDEEGSKTALSLDLPSLTLFANASNDNDEKKGGEEGAIGWSAAPTLVERQRENLTERLKREFGLLLSDDEEERARKQGLTAEAILKTHKSPPPNLVANTSSGYSGLPQLPPQPYIPPPGSASIHYPQFQSKPSAVQYPNFAVPPPTTTVQQSMYSTTSAQAGAAAKQTQQQFLAPQAVQAPPGSNPYPPPSGNQVYPSASSGQPQKPFSNNPVSRS